VVIVRPQLLDLPTTQRLRSAHCAAATLSSSERLIADALSGTTQAGAFPFSAPEPLTDGRPRYAGRAAGFEPASTGV
jgi:hypothetical protein